MMDRDTLGYSMQRGSKNLGGVASGDHPTFGAGNSQASLCYS